MLFRSNDTATTEIYTRRHTLSLHDALPISTLEMCLGELPLIFSLPAEQILSLGPRLIQGGASAISIASPRGALATDDGKLTTGRLHGQSLFPRSLEIVYSATQIGLPIIGAGGVWTDKDVTDMLAAGAMAVQMDTSLWAPK